MQMVFTNATLCMCLGHARCSQYMSDDVQVLSVNIELYTAGSETGGRVLQQLKAFTLMCPAHQSLACHQALLELRLHKFGDALATVQQFVGPKVGQECAPAQWAAHLSAHVYWLQEQLPMVRSQCVSSLKGWGQGIAGGTSCSLLFFSFSILYFCASCRLLT